MALCIKPKQQKKNEKTSIVWWKLALPVITQETTKFPNSGLTESDQESTYPNTVFLTVASRGYLEIKNLITCHHNKTETTI